MERLFIFADFNWLGKAELVGGHASQEVERSEGNDVLPEKKWIAQLIQPGTSLGGARPKAGVLDEKGNLCIAKFPFKKVRIFYK